MPKTLLLTGAMGFIGSHACVAFEQAGYHTIILDNLHNSSRTVLEGIKQILGRTPTFVEGDLRDAPLLKQIFSDHQIDGVVHFAALKSVSESCSQTGEYYDNNIRFG
jgi:UDP-glucose 4-epimerase